MYSSVRRDAAYVARLADFIRREYRLAPTAIAPAKRGFYGETWKLTTASGRYFVKLDASEAHKAIYERSFPVIEHLRTHGVDFISKIVKTAGGTLSTRLDGAVLGVFDWIDGEHIESDETKWPEYQMIAKVYTVPAGTLAIRREDFSASSADCFFVLWGGLKHGPESEASARTLAVFERHRALLAHRAERLALFAGLCQGDTSHFFITHGDAGGNLIQDGGKAYLVDWDDPVLAPPERDAWVMCPHGWAMDAFHAALRRNGIHYALHSERLAYYCYHSFFFYLTEYLEGFTQAETAAEIEGYFDGWVEGRLAYAESF